MTNANKLPKLHALMLPNFLVVGAPRCGTTSLYHYLKQHPQIYMSPRKEPHFFNNYGADPSEDKRKPKLRKYQTLADYATLFEGVTNELAIGEGSTSYLGSKRAPANIKQYLPNAKLIVILRDPAERANSMFVKNVKDGIERARSLQDAMREERAGAREGWTYGNYMKAGLYYVQLQRYLELFPREQLLILLFDDLKAQPLALLKDIWHFLEVDDSCVPDISRRHNSSGIPRVPWWHNALEQPSAFVSRFAALVPSTPRRRIKHSLLQRNLRPPPSLEPQVRREMVEYYQKDILALQDLLQRDLSHWLA